MMVPNVRRGWLVALMGALVLSVGARERGPEPLVFDTPAENDRGAMLRGSGSVM